MKHFNVEYHNDNIQVSPVEGLANEQYRLDYPDGRWLIMGKRPDDTKTVATYNENISYSTATVWAIESKAGGPDWVNTEQLQVIGELIARKEQEIAARTITEQVLTK